MFLQFLCVWKLFATFAHLLAACSLEDSNQEDDATVCAASYAKETIPDLLKGGFPVYHRLSCIAALHRQVTAAGCTLTEVCWTLSWLQS